MEQRCPGTPAVWSEPFVPLRLPKLFNLRTDPFERADITSNTYYDWLQSKSCMVGAASGIVEQFSATFTIDQALERMKAALGSGGR